MLVLTIRTDKPGAEIGLYENNTQIAYETWQAHRQLAETIHNKLEKMLHSHNKELKNIDGVVVYKGPGSFTGIRIGASVAGALAYSLGIPIIGINGESWQVSGAQRLQDGADDMVVQLEYGSAAITTLPKK